MNLSTNKVESLYKLPYPYPDPPKTDILTVIVIKNFDVVVFGVTAFDMPVYKVGYTTLVVTAVLSTSLYTLKIPFGVLT